MCFSANANFIASAGIAGLGIATLRHVAHPRAVLFGAVPLLFALHQLTEGFVWLGVHHDIRPEAFGHMTFLFILYAQGILPFLMPLAVLLMEKQGWRFNVIFALTVVGALLLSSHKVIRRFGILNVIGVVGTLIVRSYAFTSIWCAYAALVSVMLYWQFSRGHIDVDRPNSSLVGRARSALTV